MSHISPNPFVPVASGISSGIRVLVIAENTGDGLSKTVPPIVSAARQLGGEVHVLINDGSDAASALAARAAAALPGVSLVKIAETAYASANEAAPRAEDTAALILAHAGGYTHILAADSGYFRNVLSRLGALLGVEPITGVVRIASPDTFVRPVYAGNALLTVRSGDPVKILTLRAASLATASDDAETNGDSRRGSWDEQCGQAAMTVVAPAPATLPAVAAAAVLLERRCTMNIEGGKTSPSLDSARIVVAGGRGLGSAENFTMLLTPLAEQLGAALGASYGAVSAGYAANALQIGQTGRIIAPELYIAVGISGAIQHLAGVKEARVIVAIDKDPEAPIFKVADYGLVADLFDAVPALTRALAAMSKKA